MVFPSSANRLTILVVTLVAVSLTACGGAQARRAKHMAKGREFFAAANYPKARVEFQNALQIAPTDAQARYENGLVDEKLGKVREAAQFYQATIDVAPDFTGARARLARIVLLSGDADRALDLVKPGLEKHPDDVELLAVRAAARWRDKDTAGAMGDAQRAVALDPKNEDAVAALAGLYTSTGANDKAQGLLEQSIQKIPGTVDLRLVLAQLYTQERRPDDAEAMLVKLIELRPKEMSHRVRLAQFYARADEIDAAERTLRQAVHDLPEEREIKLSLVDFLGQRRGRDAAEQELQTMIKVAPEDSDLKFALARFYLQGKESAKAEAIYKGVISSDGLGPAGLSARDQLAALRLEEKDVPGALALTNEVLAKSPRDDEALLIRGTVALSKQDPRSAIADLRAVLRDQPNAIGVLRTLARAHLANGEPAVAEETMRHAAEANPDNLALQLDFAELLVQLGKHDQAKSIIADVVKKKPDSADALNAQFRLAVATHDQSTAKSAADAVVALRPKAAIGYMYQGMVAESDNHVEDALRLYSTAADLEPDTAEPLEAVVRILANTNRMPQAMKRLDDVSARFTDGSLALVIKAELLVRTGKPADALAPLDAAIARTPKWWRPYRDLAMAQLAAKQDPSVAIATLRHGEATTGGAQELHVDLARLLEKTGKPDEAIREYEQILATDAQSEVAANNLAMLLATYHKDQASLDRARDLTARFSNSQNLAYLDTYAWVLYKRGDVTDSVPVFERILQKQPNAAVARYHLGMAQSLAGDKSGARDNLTRAVNSGTQFDGIEEARAQLDRLATSAKNVAAPST
jgi:tetratricopeptide (TPR) repeat protein